MALLEGKIDGSQNCGLQIIHITRAYRFNITENVSLTLKYESM